MAPPRNPAPKPQPNPRPHTFSTSVPVAFLIASASANGVADATLEAATTPAASTAATDMFSIRLDIGFLRFFGPRHRFTEAHTAPPHVIVREICDRNSTRQGLVTQRFSHQRRVFAIRLTLSVSLPGLTGQSSIHGRWLLGSAAIP